MPKSEAWLERNLVREIAHRGGMARKFVSPGWRGAPDRIVLMSTGRVWFVEVKSPGERPRPLQVKRAREIEALGFDVRTVSNERELAAFLKEVDRP